MTITGGRMSAVASLDGSERQGQPLWLGQTTALGKAAKDPLLHSTNINTPG